MSESNQQNEVMVVRYLYRSCHFMTLSKTIHEAGESAFCSGDGFIHDVTPGAIPDSILLIYGPQDETTVGAAVRFYEKVKEQGLEVGAEAQKKIALLLTSRQAEHLSASIKQKNQAKMRIVPKGKEVPSCYAAYYAADDEILELTLDKSVLSDLREIFYCLKDIAINESDLDSLKNKYKYEIPHTINTDTDNFWEMRKKALAEPEPLVDSNLVYRLCKNVGLPRRIIDYCARSSGATIISITLKEDMLKAYDVNMKGTSVELDTACQMMMEFVRSKDSERFAIWLGVIDDKVSGLRYER